MTETAQLERLIFDEVDIDRRADFEKRFECRGSPKSCWCIQRRANPEKAKRTDGASRKAAIFDRIPKGVTVGLIGYMYGEPVAWCRLRLAPRIVASSVMAVRTKACGPLIAFSSSVTLEAGQ
jgi:hypothetical protein